MRKVYALLPLFFVVPLFAFAQFNTNQDITLTLGPSSPEPGDTVRIEATSFVTDLNRANMRWSVNGSEVASARGLSRIEFTASDARTYNVELIATTQDIGTLVKTLSFTPASVDLLWEATNSHIPLLYRGKAHVAHDGGVIVQAFPELVSGGTTLDPRTLVYRWSVNNKPQLQDSGVGNSILRFSGPVLYRSAVVTLDVESQDGSIRARRSVTLNPSQPEIIFYKQNPLLGERLLAPITGRLTLDTDEVLVRAEPYYFSDVDNESVVDYDWTVDRRDVITVGDRNLITLRRPEEGSGQSTVTLEIKHLGKILQFGRSTFSALYDADRQTAEQNRGETNFFGN